MHKRNIQKVSWAAIRSDVLAANAELALLIDQLNPDDRLPLYEANYCFGDLIVDRGALNIPNQKNSIHPLSHSTANTRYQKDLGYCPIPLGLVLNKSSEAFLEDSERSVPLALIMPGQLFGTYEAMNFMFGKVAPTPWSITAGQRTLFSLARISESSGLKRLRSHYKIPSGLTLQSFNDHWPVFKILANSDAFTDLWTEKILFFGKQWLDYTDNSIDWKNWHRYLQQQAWDQVQGPLARLQFSHLWNLCAEEFAHRRIKPSTYTVHTLKNLALIAIGQTPGMAILDRNTQPAPVPGLQDAIVDIYKLNHYMPHLMGANFLSHNHSREIYYSLNYPTLLEGYTKKKNASTLMAHIREIKLLSTIMLEQIASQYQPLQTIKFNFIHTDQDKYNEILRSSEIPRQTPSILALQEHYPNRGFCDNSRFWRGCVSITDTS